MMNFADRIIHFNKSLAPAFELPFDFAVLNPYIQRAETIPTMEKFYQRFYKDNLSREFIIGINPSRHGAGITGVPFTDTKRLASDCGIEIPNAHSHELSSVFLYDVIRAYGGASLFYKHFFINSPFPLAIVRRSKTGQWLNANYYDDKALFNSLKDFMRSCLEQYITFGLKQDRVFILGKKNASFIEKIEGDRPLFREKVVLEHPRFIQQYRSKDRDEYIQKYLNAFSRV